MYLEQEKQEDLHIAQYLESVQERESAEKLRRQALQDEADRIYTRLCQEKDEQARRIEEENDLLDMLREEEAEQKKRLEKSERLRKAEIARQETKRENEQQVKMKVCAFKPKDGSCRITALSEVFLSFVHTSFINLDHQQTDARLARSSQFVNF